uniref:Uncharacterized protein n=1 Tax=Labrus bergylta TaxID=56723 RepID=A0A3Q3NDP8_9LABR
MDSQLQVAVTQAASLISMASHNVRITLENKQETALDLAHWYVLQLTRAPFERFRDGLASLGVLDALQKYPLQLKSVFVHAVTILKNTSRCSFNCVYVFLYFTVEKGVSLEDILVFFTGCDSIPALGFSPKPMANTCENILSHTVSCSVHCLQT